MKKFYLIKNIEETMGYLIKYRNRKQLTQKNIGKRMNLSQSTICRIENNNTIKKSVLIKYANSLGINIKFFDDKALLEFLTKGESINDKK